MIVLLCNQAVITGSLATFNERFQYFQGYKDFKIIKQTGRFHDYGQLLEVSCV